MTRNVLLRGRHKVPTGDTEVLLGLGAGAPRSAGLLLGEWAGPALAPGISSRLLSACTIVSPPLGSGSGRAGKALQALACRSRSRALFSWLRSDGINQSAFASKVLQRVLEPSRPCVIWPSFELPARVYRNKQNRRAPWGKQLLPGTHLL